MNKVDTKVLSQKDGDRSVKRIRQLMAENISYNEMAEILTEEGYKTLRLKDWTSLSIRQLVFKLKHDIRSWYGLSARRAGLIIKKLPEAVLA